LTGTTALDNALKKLVASNANANPAVQLSTCSQVGRDRLQQRYAYLALIYSTGKDNIVSWYDKSNECEWKGFSCDFAGILIELDLRQQGLVGTIPEEVGLWTNLNGFLVDSPLRSQLQNSLTGSLPSSIGKWTGIAVFSAFNNKIGGSLPSSIGAWTMLSFFSVANNQLVGSLPSSIGNWTGIFTFDVSTNQLGGTVPKDVSKWTSLETSRFTSALFYSNSLTGSMPTIGNNWCPAGSTTKGQLQADCKPPVKILCPCCTACAPFN
jgi:hypothetical protein